MGQRKLCRDLPGLFLQLLLLLHICHGVQSSRVLDEVYLPDGVSDTRTAAQHRWGYGDLSDDEDFMADEASGDDNGSTEVGSGSLVSSSEPSLVVTGTPYTTGFVIAQIVPQLASISVSEQDQEPLIIYYRALVNFTQSIEYTAELDNVLSEEFRDLSEAVVDTLESEYYKIPGEQMVSVVFVKPIEGDVFVELDVGSEGNDNDKEIREILYSVVDSGSIASYIISSVGFQFRRLGAVTPTIRSCTANEFTCKNGNCIPLEYQCDRRPDCRDLSDEEGCENGCEDFEFQCRSGECIPRTYLCDGRSDCKDSSDELQCGTTQAPKTRTPATSLVTQAITTVRPATTPAQVFTRPPVITTTPAKRVTTKPPPDFDPRLCRREEARCPNGQCIPRDYLCDGEKDCPDGSDERRCGTPSPCEPNEFKCQNGRCALKLWRCDGDNDCGDGSDELNCPTKGPTDTCSPEQFVCVQSRTCIPASYQCDEEADCPDRSDEIGCTPPQVITPPEESIMASRGETVRFTCVAVGVPTPIITWRLNWGNIPTSKRVSMTSESGQGILTIRDVKEADQGAYTCEAINAKGMVFGIPDGVLILKPTRGPCPEGSFHVEATSKCIPCFCFGVTKVCQQSTRYRNQIRLRFDVPDDFKGVNVSVPSHQGIPPLSSNQLQIDPLEGEFQLVDLSRRFLSHDSFWTLPSQFLGNKVDSYGGFLSYNIRYGLTRGQSEPVRKTDVILVGNGQRLTYRVQTVTQPSVLNQRKIQFTEENWQHESGSPVTREDLLMTLQNLESIMIQTVYDNKMASVGISDIVMDTTSVEYTQLGLAIDVEECRCPVGYSGLSCEVCAAQFERVPEGPFLGTCSGCNCNNHASSCDTVTGYCLNCQHNTEGPQCNKCKAGFFGDPTKGVPNACQPCPCPHIDPQRRFSDTCFLDTDRQPTCDNCLPGYTGRRCEKCAEGYSGSPMQPGGKCERAGQLELCDPRGSAATPIGACICKAHVQGTLCNECKSGTFYLSNENPDGCLRCFCMGVTKQCSSSFWNRDLVRSTYDSQERVPFTISNVDSSRSYSEDIRVTGPSELTFGAFSNIPQDVYFWVLPERFKGDKVTSYGGELRYTINYEAPLGSQSIYGKPDVVLQGNGIFLEHYANLRTSPGYPLTITVGFRERFWRRTDGQDVTREHLLMALADISLLMIRASYAERMTEIRISNIHMDVAVPHSTGLQRAVEVEQCVCPPGYTGQSCQDCDIGYTRSTSGLYLGICERCQCNGHSTECDGETGDCQNCLHHTEGPKCDQCRPGFYGDPKRGTPSDCQPCPCISSSQYFGTCFLDRDGYPTCDSCPPGYAGRQCEKCAPGYRGDPARGQRCTLDQGVCRCDLRGSVSDQCDSQGQCQCKPHVEGPTCSTCRPNHFYLSAESSEGCLPCFCMGVTQQCASSSYHRELITSPFLPGNFQNFALVNRQHSTRITTGFTVEMSSHGPQLTYGRFDELGQESYYWQLPEGYQGDKRELYFARMRRAHKQNDSSLTEEELRRKVALGELRESHNLHRRSRRQAKIDEKQKQIDSEIWNLLSSFSSHRADPLSGRVALSSRHVSPTTQPVPSTSRPAMSVSVPVSHTPHPVAHTPTLVAHSSVPITYTQNSLYPSNHKSLHKTVAPPHSLLLGPPGPPSLYPSHHAVGSRSSSGASARSVLPIGAPGHFHKQSVNEAPSRDSHRSSTEDSTNLLYSRNSRQKGYSLVYKGFSLLPEGAYYWQLPRVFLGDKVASYGGKLRYTLSYNGGIRGAALPDADVQITGNDITLVAYQPELRPRESKSFEVVFRESHWKRPDGMQTTREHLMMVLAHLDEILIRASYSTDMLSASITGVSMETASSSYTSLPQALEVEECRCPPGYRGLSCQDCAPGYTRTGGGLYLGHCEPCDCNGHSDSCHPETGACSNCLHNTAGEFCDKCAPGFYGDATAGTPEDCQPCACPLAEPDNQFSRTCEILGSGGYRCTACQPGYTGQYCERCAPGYTGNPTIRGQKCVLEDRRSPLVVRIHPQKTTVTQGGEATLRCHVSGNPPYYFYWSREDGRPLPGSAEQREKGEELHFSRLQPLDSGVYICTCRNLQYANTSKAEILVTAVTSKPITVTVEEQKVQTVRQNADVTFICTAKSKSPAYTLVWTRQNNGKLPERAMDFNGILTIRNVQPEDAGIYVCTGSNMFDMDEGNATLFVRETSQTQMFYGPFETIEGHRPSGAGTPPTAVIEPRQLTVQRGQSAEFRCIGSGYPTPTVEWSGGQNGGISSRAIIQGGILRFPSVEPSDEGQYTCRVVNSVGQHLARADLRVHSGSLPDVQVSPERTEVREGDTVRLYCRAGGSPSATITWRKLGGSLPSQALTTFGFLHFRSSSLEAILRRIQELQARTERTDISTLVIPSIRAADAGTYLCVGTSSAGSSQARLEVIVTQVTGVPAVRIEPSSDSIIEGQNVELNCVVGGYPHAVVTWHRLGRPLSPNHQVQGSLLRILQASPEDSGEYICRVTNGAGVQQASITITITRVSGPSRPSGSVPPIRIEPSSNTIIEGQTLELNCLVADNQNAVVTWQRQGRPLSPNHQISGSRLRILQASVADSGQYICRVINGAVTQQASIVVTITRVTGPSYPSGSSPAVRIEPSSSSVAEGQTLVLTCVVAGQPGAVVTWHRSGRPLSANHQVLGSRLRIVQASTADSGEYICRVTTGEVTRQASIMVTITQTLGQIPSHGITPTIRIESPSDSLAEGQTVVLNCVVEGQTQQEVTWYRPGRPLSPNHQVSGSHLRIVQASPRDSGEYICRVSSSSGVQMASITVSIGSSSLGTDVAGPIQIQPSSRTVEEGQTLELNCMIDTQPGASVTWMRPGGRPLSSNHQVSGSRMRILQASPADSGEYICRVSTASGVQQASITVTIIRTSQSPIGAPTPVIIEKSAEIVYEGQALDLNCVVVGHPHATVTWHRSGTPIAGDQMSGSRLRIHQTAITDSGEYICRYKSSSGTQEASITVSIQPRTGGQVYPGGRSPVISLDQASLRVNQGDNATFRCHIHEGAQPIHLSWKMAHNQPLQDNVNVSPDGSVISIVGAHHRNQGSYRCIASNAYGKIQSAVTLLVEGRPTVSVIPHGPVTVKVGDPIYLECMGMGDPRPVVSWRRTGARQNLKQQHLVPLDSNAVLQILSAKPGDSGSYTCTAHNPSGSSQAHVDVRVEGRLENPDAPTVTVDQSVLVVLAGERAVLSCSAAGSPTPTITWSKLRAPLPWQHQIINNTLVIPKVAQQDSGQYICNASSAAGHSEVFVTLDVENPPYATTIPDETSVSVGELIRLQCIAHGTAPLRFQWSKVNATLPDRATLQDSILLINSAAPEDAGTYRCTVSNKVGRSEALSQVSVLAPFAVRVSPQIDTKAVGGAAEFTCNVIGDPAARIQWLKEGGALPSNHNVQGGVLRIPDLERRNEGVYTCRASSKFGQAQDSGKLVVQALPRVMINVRTSVQTVLAGNSVEFECLAIGDPQAKVTWSKVGTRMPPDVIINGAMLKIEQVKQSDAGQYRCTATNDIGEVQSHVILHVQSVPQIAAQPEMKEITTGSIAVFPCLASGFPVPEITWTKLEGDLPKDSQIANNVLTIRSVKPEDAGTYVCTAANRQGRVTAFSMLKVRERVVPYFTRRHQSHLSLPSIKDAHKSFEIKITFRPDAADAFILYSGMLVYSGQKKSRGADFVSFGLVGGRPEFRFDAGSGMATIRYPTPIALGEFHTVTLNRNLTQGSLLVDNQAPVNGTSQGKFQGLDLNEELYLGGYPDYDAISKTGLSSGFVGCVRQLIVQGEEVIFKDLDLQAKGISNCPTCRDRPCRNGGMCRDSESSSYVCVCPRGFAGSNCEHSQALHCHPGACGPDATCINRADGQGYTCRCHLGKSGDTCMEGIMVNTPNFDGDSSYISYPPLTNIHNELRIDMEFKPLSPDGLLFFSGGKGAPVDDFVSLAVTGGHLEFRFELGSGLAVLRSTQPVALGQWHKVSAERLNKDGTLLVDSEAPVKRSSPGKSQGLNLKTPMYLGGVDNTVDLPTAVNVNQSFQGCIGEVSINGKKMDISYSFIESRSISQCYDSSPCDRMPCLHGGRCLSTGEYEFQCLCRDGFRGVRCETHEDQCQIRNPCLNGGTCKDNRCHCVSGYTGTICEHGGVAAALEHEWTVDGSGGNDAPGHYGSYFSDDSYIALPRSAFPRSRPEAPETIELEIRTTSADGVILWQGMVTHGSEHELHDTNKEENEQGKGKDFISLGLKDGHLLFSYQLGSGEANILSEDPVNDGEWHKITAIREGKSGSIQVDGEEMVTGLSPGKNIMVNTKGSVYLGGVPSVKSLTGGKFTSGITGCIKNLVLLNARPSHQAQQPIDLKHHAEAGHNTKECPS
ncbi:basement membrane-specific heparan sulfate proteoglycan core protein isoform X4 [Bombina bombina]|uniref:basement membrane-specific heparan sulfate proteoglycan core protein isoform X4 n=1 Tax=Bombina bombina TaxID=8345 RepID=UPI00235AAAA8|nr:basement membrane-specific heparan sulfate proteoglycan core protein isoform X4 [Bombina bombina]